jgi:hypothetical protein
LVIFSEKNRKIIIKRKIVLNLIITIIAIALTMAMIVITTYYSGGAFNNGSVEARASKYISDTSQVAAAIVLRSAKTGELPVSDAGSSKFIGSNDEWMLPSDGLSPLVSGGYISSIPVTRFGSAYRYAEGVSFVENGVTITFNKVIVSTSQDAIPIEFRIPDITCDKMNEVGKGDIAGCLKNTDDWGNVFFYKVE